MARRGENIRQRKDGLWEARYKKGYNSSGKVSYGSVYGHSYLEVKAKRREILDMQILRQKPILRREISIGGLVDEWLLINRNRIRPSTYERYRGFLKNHINPLIGRYDLILCTPAVIQEFALAITKKNLSVSTVNSILILLHSCFKYAHRQYQLSPPEIIYLPAKKHEMRVLSRSEQRRLEAFLFEDIDICKFGVMLTLYTGLRIGELCALRWDAIDSDTIKVKQTIQRLRKEDIRETYLHIGPPKTEKSIRDIPIPSVIQPLIKKFRNEMGINTYLLGGVTEPKIEPRTMQNRIKSYYKAVGIEGATFHTLRHTFATRCVEEAFELKTLTEVLGHSGIETTLNLYVHTSAELKRSNMEKLSNLW